MSIPSFKRAASRVCILSLAVCAAYAQAISPVPHCRVTTTPVLVSSEGLAERVGDVLFTCESNPGTSFNNGYFQMFLQVDITNRVDAAGMTTDAFLAVDLGNGFVPTGTAGLISGNRIAFNNVSYTVPASGMFALRISNVRGAINRLGTSASGPIQIIASVASSLPIDQSQLIVAYSQPGFLSNLSTTGISCYGSPSPASIDYAAFFEAGTALASTRVTEGFATAFTPRQAGADAGTRFVVKYSAFPATAHLYIPDLVAGSTALKPTSGGDLNLPPAIGQYMPGSNSLLLVRVNGADATGAGGYSVAAPQSSSPISLTSVSEVLLSNGAGYAVYEVADSNPNVQETAQFPTFISLPRQTPPAVAQESIALAPVSAVSTASATAPVPRFAAVEMRSDCSLLGDCGTPFVPVPRLELESKPLLLTGVAGGSLTGPPAKFLVHNRGAGTMDWTTNIIYSQGTNWLTLTPAKGSNEGSIQVAPVLTNVSTGIYTATIIVDAGTAGRQSVPVTMMVAAAPAPPPPPAPTVVVTKVLNAATLEAAPLVPGSITTLMGTHLSGKSVAVTFDGTPATLFYTAETQINLLVPATLGAKASASLIVTVDGESSTPTTVPVAAAWPAIFAHGVLNQNGSENLPQASAKSGDILQIFATGIPQSATVGVQFGERKGFVPVYAGAAPGILGVQQVNVAVPDGASGPVSLKICATVTGQETCSPAAQITVR
jgi:uncharacterized protein (TIGR03437 family)